MFTKKSKKVEESDLLKGLPVTEHIACLKRVVASNAPASYPWLCSILEAYEEEEDESA
jgi:hypothetical protein